MSQSSTTTYELFIVACRDVKRNVWTANLDGEQGDRWEGSTVFAAIRRWLLSHQDRYPGPHRMILDGRSSNLDRRVMRVIPATGCETCGGSGRYVGLTIVEPCQACDGTGFVGRDAGANI